MHKPSVALAAACSAVLALVACSSSSTGSGSTASSPVTSPETSAAADGPPSGAQVLGTFASGQPFTITTPSNNAAQPSKFKLTVNSVVCGKGLDLAVLAYASFGESDSPAPTPANGTQYCVMSMDAVNVGNASANWDASNTVSLNVGAAEYTETSQDQSLALDYEQYWHSKGQDGPTFGINPGAEGPVHGVFEIPIGATPTSLWVTSGTAITTLNGVEPGYLIKL